MTDSLNQINREIAACRACPRLVAWRERVAREKRRMYRDWDYWGRGVPSFGDPRARLLILGLAPAAHGANRTGRMFTGDSSGDLLYATLHATGFASQSRAGARYDGMKLRDVWITATVHCAPPANKPLREESARCRTFLERELDVFRLGTRRPQLRAVIALGKIAFEAYLTTLLDRGLIASRSRFKFAHGARYDFAASPAPLPALLASYHPSRQNTQTGRLTPQMFLSVFQAAGDILSAK